MSIGREDTEKKMQWMLKMVHAFDAPNIIIVAMDEEISSDQAMFNLGLVTQNIVLLALEYGLGTCIMAALLDYPDVVRQMVGIPQSKKLAMAIAIGYPDWDFPANKLQTTREPLENLVTWQGVD
jgi:nitroreductase